jgi:hypothetical protein
MLRAPSDQLRVLVTMNAVKALTFPIIAVIIAAVAIWLAT